MSKSIDVYKIPTEYKNLDYYEAEHVFPVFYDDDKYCVYTLGVFDRVNIITTLFNISVDKAIPLSGNGGLFNSDYLVTLEGFLKAKNNYFNNYNCDILAEDFGIEKKEYSFIHEGLVDFFNELEPIFQSEKKMFFSIG